MHQHMGQRRFWRLSWGMMIGSIIVLFASTGSAHTSSRTVFLPLVSRQPALESSLSAGYAHVCRLTANHIECWGDDTYGQASPPTDTFTQVSAGARHTCGLTTAGQVVCWGDTTRGQTTAPLGTFTQISAGTWHTCGVTPEGQVRCWGGNDHDQTAVPTGSFTQVSAGIWHTCALQTDGPPICWGDNQFGQATPPAASFTQLSAGGRHTCGLQADGQVRCWGVNTYGQATPAAASFTQLSAGGRHTCGLQADGIVLCWGLDDYAQATPPTQPFTTMQAGSRYTCGVTTDQQLICWGDIRGLGDTSVSSPEHASDVANAPRCFEETGHCINGRIRAFWEQNGGLAIFGYPISAQQKTPIAGQSIQAQWFERTRLELHPTNAPPYDVLLGRLGVDVLAQQGRDWQQFPQSDPQPDCRYFAATQQNVCGEVLTRWQADGLDLGDPGISEAESLALFGLPISPLQEEEIDGQRYEVQWFERARFELHPAQSPPFRVLLGLLGKEGHETARTPLRLAVAADFDGNDGIYLINADGSEPVELTAPPESGSEPVWSSDGTRIAFTSWRDGQERSDIYVMDADGSNLTRLTDNPASDWNHAWSPDGTRIAFLSGSQTGTWVIYTMNADGSEQIPLVMQSRNVFAPAWSPDGTRIAFWEGAVSDGVVSIINADGSGLQRLADGNNPRWSPDGTRLVFATPLQDDLTNTLVTINADGSDLTTLITGQSISRADWSPDGTRIVFSMDTVGMNSDIFLVNADGSGLRQLTDSPETNDFYPAWSPDGRMIAFRSSAEGLGNPLMIRVMNVDGSNNHRLARGGSFSWQPLPPTRSSQSQGLSLPFIQAARE